ncbi:hypothetical protein [Pannonibacter phragmitetus]|uniref:hypothetical protein n=1 Tax=Pannonibacter phragmitetus TaxID=121719 RepID=UPI003D2EA1B3
MDQLAQMKRSWPQQMDESAYAAAILRCADNILPMHMGERLINKIFGKSLQSHAAGLLAILHCRAQLGEGSRPRCPSFSSRWAAAARWQALLAC